MLLLLFPLGLLAGCGNAADGEESENLKELHPDIPEISYIDGKLLFEAYNKWLESQ